MTEPTPEAELSKLTEHQTNEAAARDPLEAAVHRMSDEMNAPENAGKPVGPSRDWTDMPFGGDGRDHQ